MSHEPMPPISVNTDDSEQSDQRLRDHFAAGHVVLNAPRPIDGPHIDAWVGQFRAGRHYAAYEAGTEPAWATYERMDADQLLPITDAEIRERVIAALAADGYSLADYTAMDGSEISVINYVADIHHLPRLSA